MWEGEPADLLVALHLNPAPLQLSAIALSPVRAATESSRRSTRVPVLLWPGMAAVPKPLPRQAAHRLQSSRTLYPSLRVPGACLRHQDLYLEQRSDGLDRIF